MTFNLKTGGKSEQTYRNIGIMFNSDKALVGVEKQDGS